MIITCTYPGAGGYIALAWALASLGYAIGVALHRLPMPGGSGSQWGGYLMSYSLATAGVLAVLGVGDAVTNLVNNVQAAVPAGKEQCEGLPGIYMDLGMKAFTLLGIITGIGMGTSIIPIVGPAIANVFSVVATVPGLVLSITLITAFTLMTFITVFGSLAVALAPAGIVLLSVPGGKTKGIGAWLLAAAIVFAVAGPYIPAFGLLACGVGDLSVCQLNEITRSENLDDILSDVFSLVAWMFNPQDNELMKMWRFALGSLAGWGILMAASAALSKGMGGVAASLGFG